MTILATIEPPAGFATRDQSAVPAPSSTFLDLVLALDPVGIWPLGDLSITAFTDLTGTAAGEWVSGQPNVARPSLVGGSDYSTECNEIRGRILHNDAHKTAGGGCFIVFQMRDTTKQTLVARAQGTTAGRFVLECFGSGQLRAQLRDSAGTSKELLSATSAITKGVAYGAAVTWGAAGMKLYLGSGTPVDTDATTDGPTNDSEISVAAWHTGDIERLSGLAAWLVWFSDQPSNSEIGDLMAEVASITYANADDFGTVDQSSTTDLDVLANDHYSGTAGAATVAISTQGSLGTFSVQPSNEIRYVAGVTGGSDNGAYTVNGSDPAALSVIVSPPDTGWDLDEIVAMPTGFGTWQNVWEEETAGITQAVIDANWNFNKNGVFPWQRYSMNSPDSRPAVRDRLPLNGQIEPIGWDSPHITTGGLSNLSNARYLLLRWHYWSTDPSWGEDGKFILINGGRGYVGSGYSQSNTSVYGTDGFGFNSMHPGSDAKNVPGGFSRWGGFASYKGQTSAYGHSFGNTVAIATEQWLCVDQIVDCGTGPTNQDGGYYLRVNGTAVASRTGILVAQVSLSNCKGIWMRFRPMNGGTPAEDRGHNAGDHYYGGFSMHWVPR